MKRGCDVEGTDWKAVWEFMWPIVKQGLIALLMAILTLLGYDKYIPSRSVRGPKSGKKG